jgi:hypothetical protein
MHYVLCAKQQKERTGVSVVKSLYSNLRTPQYIRVICVIRVIRG